MNQSIRVNCLINRYWDPPAMDFDGELVSGSLIDISTQSGEDDPSKLIPVGIVLLDDDTFQSIPLQFIYKSAV